MRIVAAMKQVYAPGDAGKGLNDLHLLALSNDNYKWLGYPVLYTFLCKSISNTKAIEMAKLLLVAL
jgi:hypothetical protein